MDEHMDFDSDTITALGPQQFSAGHPVYAPGSAEDQGRKMSDTPSLPYDLPL
jgi:hypothetical protein